MKQTRYWHIRMAARAIDSGGVIAYPTEAVFGLGCSPWNFDAIDRLVWLKRRPKSKGFIVVAASASQLKRIVDFSRLNNLVEILDTWPGPFTWVMPALPSVPDTIRGENGEIAVRVSAHPVIQHLCSLCGPIISTSANPANNTPARSERAVRKYFRDSLDYILPGNLGSESTPTEIRHALSGRVIRPGIR